MSVLKVLQKHQPKNNLVEEVRSLVDESVSLHWVKAHIGIESNEAADKAAKEAATRPSIDIHLDLSERSLKTQFKHRLLGVWQADWEDPDNEKGSHTYELFPRVSKSRCIYNRFLSQAATNHGLCPFYLRLFNIRACTCRCGEDVSDNIQHYLQFCPLLSHLRAHIKPGHSLLHIITNRYTSEELEIYVSFRNTKQNSSNWRTNKCADFLVAPAPIIGDIDWTFSHIVLFIFSLYLFCAYCLTPMWALTESTVL
ncbi:hypothetical protein AVEN_152056-1 [Araneus ventricosus]|uniref:RNase H type-1 domain-containing protein n=1 Tax=Araneus ventricosus TaxID=182803 RepID=A0A4Y2NBU1_ARAVE|nr:hypothetical protein AVEN_152056-1 [Araneus ventricosus]